MSDIETCSNPVLVPTTQAGNTLYRVTDFYNCFGMEVVAADDEAIVRSDEFADGADLRYRMVHQSEFPEPLHVRLEAHHQFDSGMVLRIASRKPSAIVDIRPGGIGSIHEEVRHRGRIETVRLKQQNNGAWRLRDPFGHVIELRETE